MNFTRQDVEAIAQAPETAMVLADETGHLTVDETDDDIALYQQRGRWPRYVCRAGVVAAMLQHSTPGEVADTLATAFTVTLGLRRGPYMPTNPDPRIADR